MADQFKEQGGAATMDPSALLRWATSKLMTRRNSARSNEKRRAKAERARQKAGAPHRVEYFHQVEDGYSHLAAQLLLPLLEYYEVELICHLVTVENDANLPEPDLLLPLSRVDAAAVAPHYGLEFPEEREAPDPQCVARAEQILAGVSQGDFPEAAVAVGKAVWADDVEGLSALAEKYGEKSRAEAQAAIAQGTARRAELKHYSAAMFHYGGEWYWGADRFYHLEERLTGYGACRKPSERLLCPRPDVEYGPLKDDGTLTLEIYPSLRSPYTAIVFNEALDLAERTGVRCVVRPVLPMVMRGVSATMQKGQYIFFDTSREARARGLEFGPFYDPIGEPVRRAYSLYPWACEQGKGEALLSTFIEAAFFRGVNTNREAGMRLVVEKAGLSWEDAKDRIGNTDWEAWVEENRQSMYEFGSWGVPSFRLLDAEGEEVVGLWGQDRLWYFSREIQRLLARRSE